MPPHGAEQAPLAAHVPYVHAGGAGVGAGPHDGTPSGYQAEHDDGNE